MMYMNDSGVVMSFISPHILLPGKRTLQRPTVCAQYLFSENLQVDFGFASKTGSFGAIFFGEYGAYQEPNSSTGVVVKCPIDSSLGRDLYDMERHTNIKLRQKSRQRMRFPNYLGEVIIPESKNVMPGLVRLGLVWEQTGNGDTLEDYLTSFRVSELASVLSTTSTASPLRRQLAGKVIFELALVLQDLKQCGIVHRDMKPENILVVKADPDGAPLKAIDFGSSCDWSSPFKKGLGLATCDPIYTAPEKRLDIFKPGYRFDVYSLGLIALRCALPSLTEEAAMNNFVETVLQPCSFSLSKACSAVTYGRVQASQALKNDIEALTGPLNEDMYALFLTLLAESPNDRADVSDCIRSRFVRATALAGVA